MNPEHLSKLSDIVIAYAPKLLMGILILWIGSFVIKFLGKRMSKVMELRNVDPSLSSFLVSLATILLRVALLLSVFGIVGIQTTSFVAVLGAAGLAVGMALQGSLGNFAGGTLIILLKPYKIGDFIEAQGFSGTVHDIQIFCTILKTPDVRTVLIPNGPMASGPIVNYSMDGTRRVDLNFGISYDDDIKKTKELLTGVAESDSRVLKDPAFKVVVTGLGDSSVNIALRVHVEAKDYWGVHGDFTEKVKYLFDENDISFPFPQRDVHLYEQSKS